MEELNAAQIDTGWIPFSLPIFLWIFSIFPNAEQLILLTVYSIRAGSFTICLRSSLFAQLTTSQIATVALQGTGPVAINVEHRLP